MTQSKFHSQICANECRNTHHKLVMNALQHLDCPHADHWRSLYLRYFEYYLKGSKDPDTDFKDFRNHVLHVSDNFWGGPVKQAIHWYDVTVKQLKNQNWKAAVYASGVLSHYYMDPIMPLHTGQTEEEGVIHRACEWSINKSFDSLIQQLENGPGYPVVKIPTGTDWMKTAIHQAATVAHAHYQDFIDHYNFEVGSRNPIAGLDAHLRQVTGQLLGYASVGFARIMERAFAESGAIPQSKQTLLLKLYYQLTLPVSWVYKSFRNMDGKNSVDRIAREFRTRGKVVKSLPNDEKVVRSHHAKEVLKIDLAELDARPIGPIGSKSTVVKKKRTRKRSATKSPASSVRFRLEVDEPLVNAPSIGNKTASRFEKVGITTVREFLNCDPEPTAANLNTGHIQADTIRQWQTQTRLACQIPQIYGHDAQILAACGFETPQEVAETEPAAILSLVNEFVKTTEAKFVIRNNNPPDLEEVTNWVNWSKQSRSLKAA